MTKNHRRVLMLSVFMAAAIILSACERSISDAPVETATPIATGLFVSPIASVENPMEMIEQFAKQTEAAQTAAAGGGIPATTGTPGTPAAGTPATGTTATVDPAAIPPSATPSPTISVSTPTNANSAAATPIPASTSSGPAATAPSLSGDAYILQEGEWPYCIARRYNVDPEAMLKASGLTSPDIYYAGLKLILPQGTSFPGARNLIPHPATYTVASGDTVYSVACKYGDVDPNAIASANGISASSNLTVGQSLQIP